ncbi:MAG: hypothetical protein IKX54_05100 [Lachnospiraceae bacterium]|nr:hypothetical protein [Lachnospiraceae bacterium]
MAKRRKKKKKQNDGALFLGKVVLFVIAVAAVFFVVKWGIEKWDSSSNSTIITPTPTPGGKGKDSVTPMEEGKKQNKATPTPKPVNSPTPTATPTEAPATPTPTPTEAPKNLSGREAADFLKNLPAGKLSLAKDPASYTYEPDSWSSTIEGRECICVNVIGADGMREAVFYVAVDGSAVFREVEDNVFMKIGP